MTEITEQSPHATVVRFMPYSDYHWGFLGTSAARIGVSFQNDPQPNLMFYPPLHVPEDAVDDFLDRCIANHRADGDSLWLAFTIDPADGEVSLRINLVDDAPTCIDNALIDARSFFDAHYRDLLDSRVGKDDSVSLSADDDLDDDDYDRFDAYD